MKTIDTKPIGKPLPTIKVPITNSDPLAVYPAETPADYNSRIVQKDNRARRKS